MVNAGVIDEVNYFFSGHIGIKAKNNDTLVCFTSNFLATSRYEVDFKGISSHAALAPEKGKNALLAAASATLSLHTLAQHGQGVARVNVGVLSGGSGHNIVADTAKLVFQTRGETNIINQDIENKALQVIEGAAKMYDVVVNYKKIGYADAIDFDESVLVKAIAIYACLAYTYSKI